MAKPKITVSASLFCNEAYLKSLLTFADQIEGKKSMEMLLLHNELTGKVFTAFNTICLNHILADILLYQNSDQYSRLFQDERKKQNK